ncbi:MAG TPA: C1 family peptidase, partial [Solirubrobacteraceae bacterium]
MEAALRAGREVVWDFNVAGDRTGKVWQADPTQPSVGTHAMLIVGYDRRDPLNRYFIVKNSWTPTTTPGANGYVYMSYGYLQAYGSSAGYIDSINPPHAWPELAFVGRWTLRYDGHLGTLDIYHVSGQSQLWFDDFFPPREVIDRRVGVFRDPAGHSYRVNGHIVGDEITFWFDTDEANVRWDVEVDGGPHQRIFTYTMLDGDREMAGWHELAGNSTNVGGYARRDGSLTPVFDSSLAWNPPQFLGRWRL